LRQASIAAWAIFPEASTVSLGILMTTGISAAIAGKVNKAAQLAAINEDLRMNHLLLLVG
jgi:hypothetical protein